MRAAPSDVGQMGTQIRIRIFGLPGLAPEKQKLELRKSTLAEAKKHLGDIYPDLSLEKVFLAFVNGRAVGRDWENVILNNDDSVMFVLPIGGG